MKTFTKHIFDKELVSKINTRFYKLKNNKTKKSKHGQKIVMFDFEWQFKWIELKHAWRTGKWLLLGTSLFPEKTGMCVREPAWMWVGSIQWVLCLKQVTRTLTYEIPGFGSLAFGPCDLHQSLFRSSWDFDLGLDAVPLSSLFWGFIFLD